jgi:hypothetical protein
MEENIVSKIKYVVENITSVYVDITECRWGYYINLHQVALMKDEYTKLAKYFDIEGFHIIDGHINIEVRPYLKQEFDENDKFSWDDYLKWFNERNP